VVQRAGLPRRLQFVGDAQTDQAHRLVDDQLADIKGGERQERADQADTDAGQGKPFAGRPDLAQERRDIAHRAEALAQVELGGGQGRWHRLSLRNTACGTGECAVA
jgi:hypothetical protein